jgi:hypothetical protein
VGNEHRQKLSVPRSQSHPVNWLQVSLMKIQNNITSICILHCYAVVFASAASKHPIILALERAVISFTIVQ